MSKKNKTEFSVSRYIFIVLAIVFMIGVGKTAAQNSQMRFDEPYVKVLGDSDEVEQEEQKTEEKGQEDSNKQAEVQKEAEKKAQEQIRETAKEIEVQTKDGAKIKVKKEDNNKVKVELEKGGLHYKYESGGDGVTKKVERADGETVEISEKQLERLEERVERQLEKEDLEIATEAGETKFTKDGVSATTAYPLSVAGPERSLAISTPEGEKEIKLTPDEILALLKVGGQTASDSGVMVNQEMALKVLDGQPVYELDGQKVYNFLRLFTVTQPVKLVVSADTGSLVTTQQSFLANLISLLSF